MVLKVKKEKLLLIKGCSYKGCEKMRGHWQDEQLQNANYEEKNRTQITSDTRR